MSQANEPEILILVGRNGIGKTTILNLLSGLLTLNFVPFMRVPFRYCQLRLSNGDCLFVESQRQPKSLLIGFNELRAIITIEPRDSERVVEKIEIIELIRQTAAPVLNRIHFELVNIHRLIADMQTP
jgi:ABC-type transport system involved in cytochrome c biogenesis ATPase subunit